MWSVSGWSSAGKTTLTSEYGSHTLPFSFFSQMLQPSNFWLQPEAVPKSCPVAWCILSCYEHGRTQKLWGQCYLDWVQAKGAQMDNVPGFCLNRPEWCVDWVLTVTAKYFQWLSCAAVHGAWAQSHLVRYIVATAVHMNHIPAVSLASSDYVQVTAQLHEQTQGLPIYAFSQTHFINRL